MGSRIDEPLTMTRSSTTYYYNMDGLGSVRQVLNSSGTIVESYDYDPYGNVTIYNSSLTDITSSGSGIDNPYMFTGRRFDEETGIYHYRARQYDPAIGRFLQRDLLGYYDSMNSYEYVISNPINWIDSDGEKKNKRRKKGKKKRRKKSSGGSGGGSEHTSEARPSTQERHEIGQSRKKKEQKKSNNPNQGGKKKQSQNNNNNNNNNNNSVPTAIPVDGQEVYPMPEPIFDETGQVPVEVPIEVPIDNSPTTIEPIVTVPPMSSPITACSPYAN